MQVLQVEVQDPLLNPLEQEASRCAILEATEHELKLFELFEAWLRHLAYL